MRRIVGIACLTAVAGLTAFAGNAQTPAPEAKPIVLLAAHLFDGASGKLVSPWPHPRAREDHRSDRR